MGENELGAFLRARREAVTPAEVGLVGGPRRRTPGLRRGELATIAGISVEYLTRLEQGRDRRPSPEILAALADSLRLTSDERVHVHRLVKAVTGGACQGSAPPAGVARPTVLALLDRLGTTPALVRNGPGDLLACTAGYRRLAEPLGLLDAEPANLARFVFTDGRARSVFPEWERIADAQAADLRAATALGDSHAGRLAEELSIAAGVRFSSRFQSSAALPARVGVERWAHPAVGELTLAYESLELPDAEEQRLLVYLPADEQTTAALEVLTRPAAAS
ncbi:transcriptional regulator with XRE-family HTH domain [Actinoalloteichus hoggarensis]|uniref:Helix-turn-helix protein n=1 Tax=Actinoalloteichus hoggarensis TaxID=1470176 RepID=A0A221W3F2_9PSEU|nr:helix-turn-helix domain-containing protein [Actinoalloteichus hoggarensis]ASO20390.1 helix-turn-helix protein [Actinoalloteichus hoggarensis]MBB5923428.1 transcriptional regulator with XRE-family HTH domain [Actinoalloteichus hoggarensis]